eukprot:m.225728 g.225728  ORF g.225728 m.225728 type:complete len:99 (+) comp16770_c0_seq1:7-303(+)
MDLSRVPLEEKVDLCRKYFLGGFAFLPWLWFVNSVWFFNEARKPDADPRIRKYVILSFIFSTICAVGIAVWAAIFQQRRAEWGETGDLLSVTIIKGRV